MKPLGSLSRTHHRRDKDIVGHFPDPIVRLIVQADLTLIEHYDPLIKELDRQVLVLVKGQKSSNEKKNYAIS